MDLPEDGQRVVSSPGIATDGTLAKLPLLEKNPTKAQGEEDGDYCRICRGEGTAEQPLFYPCKCSGSIRFVHQDCLMEWLSHSQKKYCELCKTPFTFTKLYDRSMPDTLPLPLFLRQIVIHSARGLLKWTRFLMVGFVWLGWLPWSIRQVWRGLFWLADGSWVSSNGTEAAAIAAMSTTASSPANGSSLLTGSLAYATTSNASIRTELANSFSEILAPLSAFLTFSTDDFLIVKLMRLLFPNIGHITRFFSQNVQPDEAPAPKHNTRLPSLLSDVTYLESLTPNTVVNNAVVDVLEGQLICLLVVTAFILIFLIREWVINQQPAANMPDPDLAEEAAAPLQVNRNLRPGVRRRRRVLREALDQLEQGQNPDRPLMMGGPGLANVPPGDEGEQVETTVHHDPVNVETAPLADYVSGSVESDVAAPSSATSVDPTPSLPTPEVRPPLQNRKALDQAVDIRRKIEEGGGDLQDLDWFSPLRGTEHTGLSSELHQSTSSSSSFTTDSSDDEVEPEMKSSAAEQEQGGPSTSDKVQAPALASGGLQQGFAFALHTKEPFDSHTEPRDDDHQSSSESNSQNAGVVDTPVTSTTENETAHSDTDEELPETPESSSGGDEPTVLDGNDVVNARQTWGDQVAHWLWHTDEDNDLPAAVIDEDDQNLVRDIEGELPLIPGGRPQQDDAQREDVLGIGRGEEAAPRPQAENPLGIELNNPDAIEEAEDLDGILELIGMQGPVAGMIQNVFFSEFLITLTIAASVWLPYIWGKIALLILANPIGMFLKGPLHLVSRAADTVVDTMLFIGALAVFAAHSCFSFFIPWLAYVRPAWAAAISQSRFMGKYLTVAKKSLTLAKGSGVRLERALSGTIFGLRPDLPTFSILSHQALRTFEQKLADGLDSTTAILTSLLQHSPLQLHQLVYRFFRSTKGNLVSPRAFLGTIPEKALMLSTYLFRNLKTMTVDLGGAPSQQLEPLDYTLVRWDTRDKVLAIVLGYTFLSVVGYLYLKVSRLLFGLTAGEKVEGIVADALTQAGGVMKVIMIIGIEMIVFPLYCGMLLNIALMPLFAGVTFASRLAFIMEAPMTALFVHWFIGTCYMFHFALFVSMCRKIMRKGVLYFIRDPDDPTYHPVRDVLERPVLGQLSKIAFSAIVYGGLVMLCLGGVIWALTCIHGILPINWVTDEPKVELPVDVILYNFLLPVLIRKIEPSQKITAAWEWWFRGCARGLRLTHFLFGEPREDEMGTCRYRHWNPFASGKDATVDLQRDGTFVRAPASDSVRIPKGDRVFLEVNKNNERVDGLEDPDDGPHGKANTNFTKVYIPPNFRARIATFIVMIWMFAATTGVFFTVIPLLLGRSMITYFTQIDRPPNDLYALTVGMHMCSGIAYAAAYFQPARTWLVAKASTLFADSRQILPKVKLGVHYALGLIYVSIAFGIVLPLMFSVMAELYFLMPLYTYLTSTSPSDSRDDEIGPGSPLPTTIHVLQTWTLGLLYLRLTLRLATTYPHGQTRAAVAIRAILRNGILRPDVWLATRAFVMPAFIVSFVLLAAPQGLGWMVNAVLDVHVPERRMMAYRYAYPGLMAGFVAAYVAVLLNRQIGVWRVRIRDEVYLIGERLHNFGEGGKSVRAAAQRSVGVGIDRVDVDIH